METNTPLLEMVGISKRFPGVVALDNVSLNVHQGEIVALIGENGAGKSTLMKILGGAISRDDGSINIDGTPVEIRSPANASSLGMDEAALAQLRTRFRSGEPTHGLNR